MDRAGGRTDPTVLIAVATEADPEQIRALIELGHVDFGETRIQDLMQQSAMAEEFLLRHRTLTKDQPVRVPDAVRWHMVGELHRPKLKRVIKHAHLLHTIDNLRIAEDLQGASMRREEPVEVLLQVNATRDKDQVGLTLPAAIHVAEMLDTMVNLHLRGLMADPPAGADEGSTRRTFERCRELFEDIRKAGIGGRTFNILSMGTSENFEIAIEEGANIVRVGRALFLDRKVQAPSTTRQTA